MNKFYILILVGATMCSCQHIYYAPNSANAPQLSEKGETRVNALYCSGGDSEFGGGELQVAYAITKNVGVMLNGFAAGESEEITSYNTNGSHMESGKGSYIEGAAGYFMALDAKRKWIADIYGGMGLGSVKNDYGFGDNSKVGNTKFFVQPSIGYKSTHFEFAFVPKLSLVNWRVKESKISHSENDGVKNEIKAIESDPSFVAFEPALLLRAGGQNFKVQAGVSFSNYSTTSFLLQTGLTESMNGHLGISINIKPKNK